MDYTKFYNTFSLKLLDYIFKVISNIIGLTHFHIFSIGLSRKFIIKLNKTSKTIYLHQIYIFSSMK